jgi:NADPH:quinone reductase-like Zn-dependent oxidoreductase
MLRNARIFILNLTSRSFSAFTSFSPSAIIMSPTNQAAWLLKANEKLEIKAAEIGKPGRGQVLVKNKAVAINPVDWKIQDGYLPTEKARILGQDIAGEIVEVGEDVTEFTKGQRVLAHVLGLATGKPEDCGFQNYSLAPTIGTCPIPDGMSFEEASVLPLALSTAAVGLFSKDHLALPKPSHDVEESGKTLLVWGAASSVGSAVVQLAVAAGLKVVATASKKNFDFCKDLGASQVFDYNSPGVAGDLTAELQKHDLAGAYDGKCRPDNVPRLPLTVPSAISTRDTQLSTSQVLAQLGGGKLALTLPPTDEIPATVTAKSGTYSSSSGNQSG